MKKLAVLFVCVALLASCDGFKGGSKDLKAENDSLLMPKAVLTCSVEPSLKTLPVPSNRLLLTSNSSPSKWKKTKRRLQSYRHS